MLELEATHNDKYKLSIAIIGMSCRFPGADTPTKFWRNLSEALDSIRFFNKSELHRSQVPDELVNNNLYVPASGHLEHFDLFDAEFFGFSNQEAQLLDPQFRLFFECAWEAFEDSGWVPGKIIKKVGVFAGTGMSLYAGNRINDYFSTVLNTKSNFLNDFEGPQVIISNKSEYLPTRISYKFNLKGPSVNIQTACSTSLVAVHMACQSLLSGECDMALAGASAIHFPIHSGYLYCEGGMYSSAGHCKTFSKNADGIVGGNGIGVVLLKRLEDAIADKDNIHAVIRSSAINNDGNSKVSYMAPSVQGQVEVLTLAQELADISPEDISYIETHGTGTQMGDPIEVAALTQAFRRKTQRNQFCALGSVKTNIGHLDTAAGMAGLIKTILSLKNKAIPPLLHFSEPNENIDFENSPFYVNTQLMPWDCIKPRIAGISAFGAGGTNAHVLLEEFNKISSNHKEIEQHVLFTLSAKNEVALEQYVDMLFNYISVNSDDEVNANDIGYTLNVGRLHFDHRIAFPISSVLELRKKLDFFSKNKSLIRKQTKNNLQQLAFLYSGQGSQYVGMGQLLYQDYKVFREALDICSALLEIELGYSLPTILWGSASELLNETRYTQPSLFALEYALTQLWFSWGIKPTVLMGHSVGEYVAACVAGVMCLEDSLHLIAARGRLMQTLPPGGGMLVVFGSEEDVKPYLINESSISIAALNGPRNTVLSGPLDKLEILVKHLNTEKRFEYQMLKVSHAFHSSLMDPILSDFYTVAKAIRYSSPKIPFVSNLTGALVTERVVNADYWVRHIRETVQFNAGMQCLHRLGHKVYLEIGPKGTLVGMGKDCIDGEELTWLESTNKRESSQRLLNSLGELYVCGYEIDWQGYYQGKKYRKISLPTYPFQRKRFWVDSEVNEANNIDPIKKKANAWRYQINWQPNQIIRKINKTRDRFVLFTDDEDKGICFADALKKQGKDGMLIQHQQGSLQQKSAWQFTIDFSDVTQWQQLMSLFSNWNDTNIIFIYLCGLELSTVDESKIDYCQHVIYPGFLYLLKLEKDDFFARVDSIWLITQSAQQYEKSVPINCLLSPLWSMARAARTENFPTSLFTVDFDQVTIDAPTILLTELQFNQQDFEVSYRKGCRYLPFLQPIVPEKSTNYHYSNQGYYIISGGVGGLGLILAKHLVERGVRFLILISRKGRHSEVKKEIKELENVGAKVIILKCNVGDARQLQESFKDLLKTGLVIKGVIHAAGVVEDALIYNQNFSSFEKVMQPKMQGAWNIYQLVQNQAIDFFVNFSSIASIFGSPGQINYVAANAFLDSFSYFLYQKGINAKVINWGPWESIGMAAKAQKIKGFHNAETKLQSIDTREGILIFEQILCDESIQTLVFSLNDQFANQSDAVIKKNTLSQFNKIFWTPNEKDAELPNEDFSLNKPVNKDSVRKVILAITVKIIGFIENIDGDVGFQDMGMDSMMGLQFRNLLAKRFLITLPSTLIYKYTTINSLTDHIAQILLKNESNSENCLPLNIDQCSTEELANLLEKELNSL